MATTRRSSAARTSARGSRTGAASASRGRSSEPRPNRDGKFAVFCPRCSASYAVPEQYLDEVVTCKHCKSVFTPRNSLQRARPAKKDAGIGGVLLRWSFPVALILGAVIIYKAFIEEEPKKDEPLKIVRMLRTADEPFTVYLEFSRGVYSNNPQLIDTNLAWESVYDRSKAAGAVAWALLAPDQVRAFKDKFVQDLAQSDLKKAFVMADIEAYSMAGAEQPYPEDAKEFTFNVQYPDRENPIYGQAIVEARTKRHGTVWKVEDWKVLELPPPKKEKKATHKPHATIKRPKVEEIEIKGRKIRAEQSEPAPVAHDESTPPAQREEIDKLIATIFTPSDDPRLAIRAQRRLEEIGAPAAPRLLNACYEIRGGTAHEREGLHIVVKTFGRVTGCPVAEYLPGDASDSTFGGTDEERLKLLKRIFGWWYYEYDKPVHRFDKTDEELDKELEAGSGAKRSAPPKKEEPPKKEPPKGQ